MLLALLAAMPARAQEFRVAAVQAWASQELLHAPRGIALAVDFPFLQRVAVRFGGSWLGIDADRIGGSCAGLIPPNWDCSPEPLVDTGHLALGSVGISVTAISRPRFSARVIPALQLAATSSESSAPRSGRRLASSGRFIGVGLDAEVVARPVETWPMQLTLAVGHARLDQKPVYYVADGYNPFTAFRVTRLELGLVFGTR